MDTEGWERALALLESLDGALDAALAGDDLQAALRLAFNGAHETVRFAAGAEPLTGPVMHRVYVELTPRPLETCEDGTLVEQRAYVNLAYQRWEVAEEEATRLAEDWALNARWPGDSS